MPLARTGPLAKITSAPPRKATGGSVVFTWTAKRGVRTSCRLRYRHSYGRKAWSELLAPAVQLAQEGMLVDWYSGLVTASTARPLSLDPDAAAMFLDGGVLPKVGAWTSTATEGWTGSPTECAVLRLSPVDHAITRSGTT